MPDGITLKRIIDMDETQQLSASDYVLVDSASGGNRKYALGEELTSLKEDKADIDGYYEDMTVGDAEQLVASQYVEDSVPYLFRTTDGSSDVGNREYVDGIVGGSIVWNQLVNSASIPATKTESGVTFTNNGDGTITVNGTATADVIYAVNPMKTWDVHKYMICGCPKGGSEATYNFAMRGMGVDRFDFGNGNIWDATGNTWKGAVIYIKSGTTVSNLVFEPNIYDLTQMFGSTIADYVYGLESATAGAGVAWFKKLFPNMDAEYSYHEDSFDEESPLITKKLRDYQPGILLSIEGLASHNTVGFNQWDEVAELGGINPANGEPAASDINLRTKNFIHVLPNTVYYAQLGSISSVTNIRSRFYDADKNYIGYTQNDGSVAYWNREFTTPDNAHFMKFEFPDAYGTTYKNDICINLSWSGWRNGEYEAYQKHIYPLDDSLTLRGIPKLDAQNNLYYDGDEYLPDGTVNRWYGIVDARSLPWTKSTANNPNGTVYETANTNVPFLGWNAGGRDAAACNALAKVSFVGAQGEENNGTFWWNNARTGYRAVWGEPNGGSSFEEFMAFLSERNVIFMGKLATPTKETAEPYQHVQICDDFGTEEYVSNSIVPVGHNTRYPANLRDKLQHLPDLADSDGYYMIGQSNKQMHLELFRIPKAPTTDGTYTLKATVSGGTPTYTWEAQT